MRREAIEAFRKGDSLAFAGRTYSTELTGYAYGALGEQAKALEIVHQFERLQKRGDLEYEFDLARVYTGLGEKNRALQLLEAAYQQRYPDMGMLRVDPQFDRLRSDPRFQDLLRRMNFPQ